MKAADHPIDGIASHGGDVYHLARTMGVRVEDLLDFSANINLLDYPAGVPAAIQAALDFSLNYF